MERASVLGYRSLACLVTSRKHLQSLAPLTAFNYRLKEFVTTLSIIRLNQPCQGYYMTMFPCSSLLPKWPFYFLLSGVFGFLFGVI
jgi:hypothetical protein